MALRKGIAMADLKIHCAFEITARFLFNLWQRCYGHFCVLFNDGELSNETTFSQNHLNGQHLQEEFTFD
jgi:hypothetical protein